MIATLALIGLWFRPYWWLLAAWTAVVAAFPVAILWSQHESWLADAARYPALADSYWALVDRSAANVLIFVLLGICVVLLRKWMKHPKGLPAVPTANNTKVVQPVSLLHSDASSASAGTQASASSRNEPGHIPSDADRQEPAQSMPKIARINWGRGLTLVFWALSTLWWLSGAIVALSYGGHPPQRHSYVPNCAYRLNYEADRQCRRYYSSADARVGGEQDPRWEACLEPFERARQSSIVRCEQERDSDSGQRAINENFGTAFDNWLQYLLVLLGIITLLPFFLAAILLGLRRLGLFVWNGFRESV